MCALSLASVAQAAVQVVNTAAYQFSFDDTVLSYLGNGELSFKSFQGVSTSTFLGVNGDEASTPILTLTANAHYQISGVSQILTGSLAGAAAGGAILAYTSWSEPSSGFLAPLESGSDALSDGDFSLSDVLDLTGASGKSLSLNGFRLAAGVLPTDGGSMGTLGIQSFKLSVQSVGGVSPVPEPRLLALVAAGFGVVMLRRRDPRA